MISELSAGCECRLFGTGLVMSKNASDCTQNAAYRDWKLNQTPPLGAAYGASTCCPSTFIICPPPLSHTSGYGPDQKCSKRQVWCGWQPPTNVRVVALCYWNSHQNGATGFIGYLSHTDRETAGNKGACSNQLVGKLLGVNNVLFINDIHYFTGNLPLKSEIDALLWMMFYE